MNFNNTTKIILQVVFVKRKPLCYKRRKCLDENRQKKGKGRENDMRHENILFEPEFLSCWNLATTIKEMYLKISITIHRERNDRIEVETGK